MDTLPLPPRPNLEQYKKRAKDLVSTARSKDPDAVRAWAENWLRALAKQLNMEITPFVEDSFDRAVEQIEKRARDKMYEDSFALADAQFVIADAHGFSSWADFATHVEGAFGDGPGREFEKAADAVVDGDLATLQGMVRKNPDLVRARSSRVHRVTLLHYVAANGVEDFRQRTPPNAVEIAKFLLNSGAEVDAVCETYGGGKAQTTMNLLVSSAHPAAAGLQSALVEVLLDHGAAINGLEDDSSPIMTALAFWYGDTAETLARRGARLDNVVAAAGVGRLEVVSRLVVDKKTLARDVKNFETRWFSTPKGPKTHIEMAFATACHFDRRDVVRFFLDLGVDVAAKDRDDMTPLHWAAANGALDLMKALLARGAPLEAQNRWGGTVLGSTTFGVMNPMGDVEDYAPVIETLLAAGADVNAADYPTGNSHVDEVLKRYGAQ